MNDTGIINTVTAILASYRVFDTMGEVVVIFTAGVGVLCLLRVKSLMNNLEVIIKGSFILVPLILLFALYVQFHGDFGPGGGFQAGAIFCRFCFIFIALGSTSWSP